uniref:Uncharacterized protein n=1 Tax=Arundo donax TaxID=35708 RepID=A0A0A9GKZ6_ARUDO
MLCSQFSCTQLFLYFVKIYTYIIYIYIYIFPNI